MDGYDIRSSYKKWWAGKYCRLLNQDREFKKVVKLRFYAPPSFFCGQVEFIYEDGTVDNVHFPPDKFRPRKSDVEVRG